MPRQHNRQFEWLYLACFLLLVGPYCAQGDEPSSTWPFFAFDNGVGRGSAITADEQAELLSHLGYQGIGYTGVKDLPQLLTALEQRKLKLFSTYLPLDLEKAESPFDAELLEAIKILKGHDTALWIHVHGKRAADNQLDSVAVKLIRQLAALAEPSGLSVVLYPHTGFYVATNQDALRIVEMVNRPNVGTSFNLCHFLKQQNQGEMESVIRKSLPYLKLVSINGADGGQTQAMGWDRLIQNLDQGDFDVTQLLRVLQREGYRGPIGLQCFAIPGDFRENLKCSMAGWQRLNSQLTAARSTE